MTWLIVCAGSFHQSSSASGGNRPKAATAIMSGQVTPVRIAPVTVINTHTAEAIILIL